MCEHAARVRRRRGGWRARGCRLCVRARETDTRSRSWIGTTQVAHDRRGRRHPLSGDVSERGRVVPRPRRPRRRALPRTRRATSPSSAHPIRTTTCAGRSESASARPTTTCSQPAPRSRSLGTRMFWSRCRSTTHATASRRSVRSVTRCTTPAAHAWTGGRWSQRSSTRRGHSGSVGAPERTRASRSTVAGCAASRRRPRPFPAAPSWSREARGPPTSPGRSACAPGCGPCAARSCTFVSTPTPPAGRSSSRSAATTSCRGPKVVSHWAPRSRTSASTRVRRRAGCACSSRRACASARGSATRRSSR